MRKVADEDRIRRFMRALGAEADVPARVYFTGGATAVLLGWRATTIDVDIRVIPESDRLYRAIPSLKESLQLNVEFAAPDDFIPALPGWEERSIFVSQEGKLAFRHYDFYAQALAKIERGHAQDLADVREMMTRRLIDPTAILRFFEVIEPRLYLYPAIDPPTFRRSVEKILEQRQELHGNEGAAFVLAQLVDRADVKVPETVEPSLFTAEQVSALSTLRQRWSQSLSVLIGVSALGQYVDMRWRQAYDLDLSVSASLDEHVSQLESLECPSPRLHGPTRRPPGTGVLLIAVSRQGDELDLCPDSMYLKMTGRTPEDLFPRLKAIAQHGRTKTQNRLGSCLELAIRQGRAPFLFWAAGRKTQSPRMIEMV